MTGTRLTRQRTLAFGIGALVVLLWLFLSGMVESRGPACSMGIGLPTYLPYQGVRYGWPAVALQVGQIACQGSSEDGTPKPFVAWDVDGVLISVVQLLAGGLLGLLVSRAFKKRSG